MKARYILTAAIVVLAAAGAAAPAVQALPKYTVTDVGTLSGGTKSRAYDLNNSAQVVGWSQVQGPSKGPHAFLWETGVLRNLETLPGGTMSEAYGINNSGFIVGQGTVQGEYDPYFDRWSYYKHAFVFDGNTMIDLGTLGGNDSWASDINDAGMIVGCAQPHASGSPHACTWDSSGDITDIAPAGCNSEANGLDNEGRVVGYIWSDPGQAFVFDSTTGAYQGLDFFGLGSIANAVNSSGRVVGSSFYKNAALMWDAASGVVWDLGLLDPDDTYCVATDINENGQIVGREGYSEVIRARAFLWETGEMSDLNDLMVPGSGWVLKAAEAINDKGHIAGWGEVNGETHGFLLTPAGDANLDSKIDGADLAIWQQNYDPLGINPSGYWTGDWNSDGKVDGADLALWQQNYNPLGLGLASVNPEPGTLLLLGTGVLCLASAVRSRRMRY